MSVGFVTPDPLNNLTNLYQRPIFIQADRTPTINDVHPAGTQWGDNLQPTQNIYETPGKGIWILIAASGSPLNTINSVAPVGSNINLIDQGGAGAIQITAPGSGGAGTVGIGVRVDGTSVVISGGNVLTAPLSASAVQNLQGDDAVNVSAVAGVIKVIGDTPPVQGAIRFQNSVAGQLDGIVQVDGSTITINAANELEVVNSQVSAVVTTVGAVVSPLFTIPLGATPGTYTFEIDVAGFCFAGASSPGSVGYTLVGAVRTTGAAAILVPGQALDEFEEAGLATADVDINVSANNAVINVTGVAAHSIRWKGTLKFVFQG